MKKKTKPDYPEWVCHDCGIKASNGKCFKVMTFHLDKCDVCSKIKQCTQARDYFYPKF